MKENERFAAHILVIDDEVEMGATLKQLLVNNGFEVSVASSAKEGLRILQSRSIDLTICDIVMADMSGLLFIEKAGDCGPIIMMTAFASIETARKAFKLGARDYLVKPFDIDELLVVINQNLKRCTPAKASSDHRWMLASRTPTFNKMMQLARQFSATDMPILITGESGVGKELFAEFMHEGSGRAKKPFIRINCAAIPDTLLESELFGYEKGAFTGATSARAGKFADADGGTMFLDEIGDMQLPTQAKMLRVLQDFQFYPLGSSKAIQVDVRIIAASNQDLANRIQEHQFREDLYHRLNGVHIRIPPLRDRVDDIGEFAQFFLELFAKKYVKDIVGIDPDALDMLKQYAWPGNIRELKNCLERSVVVSESSLITSRDLPDYIVNLSNGDLRESPAEVEKQRDYKHLITEYQSEYLRKVFLDALRQSNGNRAEAARLLNISRKTLYNRMRELNIKYEFR